MISTEEFLSKLDGVKATGADRWMARCPSHADATQSLSIRVADDRKILLNCFAGCATGDIAAAMEIGLQELFPDDDRASTKPEIAATYDYRDEGGRLVFQSVRLRPKGFRQRRPDGAGGWEWSVKGVRPVPYHLPELRAAAPDRTVFVCEGEKDCDNLAKIGALATTNAGGAGKWLPEFGLLLKGRHVVILPDNDDAGRKHAGVVYKSLEGLAASLRVLELPGLPQKGDVSDWLDAGGSLPALLKLSSEAREGFPVEARHAFVPESERLAGERAERLAESRQIIPYGMSYLDEATLGIRVRDVVIVGASTGSGKTTIAARIAMSNCFAGRRVAFIGLEHETGEIGRRAKYERIAAKYYADPLMSHPPVSYSAWRAGRCDYELARYEEEAEEELRPALKNLLTLYARESFTDEDFAREYEAIVPDVDVVILDHLHLVSSDDSNETRALRKTTEAIRRCALRGAKPAIVLSQLRKRDWRDDALVPRLDDMLGSSAVSQLATVAIVVAPAKETNGKPGRWPSYVHVAKSRVDGTLARYAAMVVFDAHRNAYEEQYVIGRLVDGGKAFQALSNDERPHWAKRSVPPTPDDEEGMQ